MREGVTTHRADEIGQNEETAMLFAELIAEIWMFLVLAFALGIAVGWFGRTRRA